MPAVVIEAKSVSRVFHQGKLDIEVLKAVDFSVAAGESHAILGASGAGKSTLMHLLGGLDHVSSGEIRVVDSNLSRLSETSLGNLRNRHLGFIYQFHHLLPEFSALENIAMPLLIRRQGFTTAYDEARDWLTKIGREQRSNHSVLLFHNVRAGELHDQLGPLRELGVCYHSEPVAFVWSTVTASPHSFPTVSV